MKSFFQKLLKIETVKIGEAALLISVLTFFSQILGLVRDRIFASTIGAGQMLDIYYTAFRVPDLIYAIVGSTLSITILLPFFTDKYQEGKNKIEARIFLSQLFSGFLIISVILCLVLFIIFPFISPYLAPGFSSFEHQQITLLSRIILISPILLGISNLFSTVTQYTKRFIVYGLAPVLYNVGIILGVWIFYPIMGVSGLGAGVLFGAILHVLIQFPTLKQFGLVPFLTFKIPWKSFSSLVLNSLPRSLGLATSQIVLLVLTSFATTISFGSVSVLNLARNLQAVPLSLIGASFSLAAFPLLVQTFKTQKKEYLNQVIKPLQQIIFWSLPLTAVFIVLRAQIVRVAFGAGVFGWSETRLTAAVLALLVLSVFAQGAIMLLVRAFYAGGRTWLPFITNVLASIFIVIIAYFGLEFYQINPASFDILFKILRIETLAGNEIIILALAFTVGTVINALILWMIFCYQNNYKPLGIWRTFWQSGVVSLAVGATAYISNNIFVIFFSQDTLISVFTQGMLSGGLAILVGIGILQLLESEEYLTLKAIISRKIKKIYDRKK